MEAKKPKTPVNFNSPFIQKLIYYKTPAGNILPEAQIHKDVFDIDALLPKMGKASNVVYKNGLTAIVTNSIPGVSKSFEKKAPVKRHSTLVKRFKSFDQVFL